MKFHIFANYCRPVLARSASVLPFPCDPWLWTQHTLPSGSFVLVKWGNNIQEFPLEAPLLPGDSGSVLTQ